MIERFSEDIDLILDWCCLGYSEKRTWEKHTILHHEVNRSPRLNMPQRYARHYYDSYCFSKSKYKYSAFKLHDLLQKVVEFKDKFYPRGWAKYEEATIKQIKLVPDVYRIKKLEKDFIVMSDYFFNETPEFNHLILGLKELECEIHNL